MAVRIARGQVDPDAAAGLPEAGPDLQELQAQGVDLGGSQFGALKVAPQHPKQAVGRGVQQQPELIGQEPVAAQAIGLELQLQLFDAVFHVAPEHVEIVINKPGVAHQVGDYEALIGAQVGIFHLGDDTAGLVPGFRLVAEGGEEALFFSRLLVQALRFFQEGAAWAKTRLLVMKPIT